MLAATSGLFEHGSEGTMVHPDGELSADEELLPVLTEIEHGESFPFICHIVSLSGVKRVVPEQVWDFLTTLYL